MTASCIPDKSNGCQHCVSFYIKYRWMEPYCVRPSLRHTAVRRFSITATPAGPGAGDTTVPQPRLVRAAHQFEAQMMKTLMKPTTEAKR